MRETRRSFKTKSAVCPRPTVKRVAVGCGSKVIPASAPSSTRRRRRGGVGGGEGPTTVASSGGGDGGGGTLASGGSRTGVGGGLGGAGARERGGGDGLASTAGGGGSGGGGGGRCASSGWGNSMRRRLFPRRISSRLLSGWVVIRSSCSLTKVPFTLPRSARTTRPCACRISQCRRPNEASCSMRSHMLLRPMTVESPSKVKTCPASGPVSTVRVITEMLCQ